MPWQGVFWLGARLTATAFLCKQPRKSPGDDFWFRPFCNTGVQIDPRPSFVSGSSVTPCADGHNFTRRLGPEGGTVSPAISRFSTQPPVPIFLAGQRSILRCGSALVNHVCIQECSLPDLHRCVFEHTWFDDNAKRCYNVMEILPQLPGSPGILLSDL